MKNKYSKYKPSGVEWLGEIPDQWIKSKMKFHVSIYRGSGYQYLNQVDEDYQGHKEQVIRIGDFTEYNPIWCAYQPQFENYRIKAEDILLGGTGHLFGNTIYVQKKMEGIIHSYNILRLSKFRNNISSLFSFYVLSSSFVREQMDLSVKGSGQPFLDIDKVQELFFFLPPLPEQEQIIKYLDEKTGEIDNLISITENKIELLKENRTSVINRVITKGLNHNVELKDSGIEWIGEIPKHWQILKGKYILEILTGFSPSDYQEDENGVWYLKVDDLNNVDKDLRISTCNLKIKEVMPKPLNGEIVVFPKRGMTIFTNKVGISNGACYIDPNLMGVKVFNNTKIDFFTYCLKIRQLGDICDSSTIPQINNKHIYPLPFPIPPFPEQEEIVKYLDQQTQDIDTLISIEQNRIDTLKEYRQSLISEVITGKVRVCEEVLCEAMV